MHLLLLLHIMLISFVAFQRPHNELNDAFATIADLMAQTTYQCNVSVLNFTFYFVAKTINTRTG